MRIVFFSLAILLAASGLPWVEPVRAAPLDRELVLSWFEERRLQIPDPAHLQICHGFGCTYRTRLNFTKAELGELARLMSTGSPSAASEREAIAQTEIWFSNRVTKLLSHARHPGWYVEGAFVEGEMDCLDVTTNTTALVLVLDEMGLLRHHTLKHPTARGIFVYGAHATTVLEDRQTGRDWVVDPWHNAPGTRADVLPLDQWYAEVGGGHVVSAEKSVPPPHPQSRRRLPPSSKL